MGPLDILGTAAAGFNAAMTEKDAIIERARKEAQQQLEALQKVGGIASKNNDGATMARLANQMPGLLKQGYGIDVPNQPIVGAPVMARGQEFIEQQGPSPIPGKRVGLMAPTPYEYDTGKRDFNNPATMDAARRGLLIAAPASTIEERDPFKVWVDTTTGKVVRPADARPTRTTAPDPLLGLKGKKLEAEIARLNRPEKPPAAKPVPGAAQDARTWAQHTADFGRDFPGVVITSTRRTPAHNAKVGGVPGSYHTKGMAFDAVPPVAMEGAIRQWAASRGMEVIVEDPGTPNYHWHFEPRGGVPAKAPSQPRIQPSKNEKPQSLVRVKHEDGTTTMEPKAAGVQVAPAPAPKAAKPFDETKADKLARGRLGIKPGRMILPSKREAYDAEMAKLRAAHQRTAGGGKTLLQTLMEEPD